MTSGPFLEFWVPGKPTTKGSFIPMQNPRTKRIFLKPDSNRSKPWADAVKLAAKMHVAKIGGLQCPVYGKSVPLTFYGKFYFVRPASHFTTTGLLKPNAPGFPMSKSRDGDGDKLLRNTWDPLTGVIWDDDSQVVTWAGLKQYGEEEGALITIRAV